MVDSLEHLRLTLSEGSLLLAGCGSLTELEAPFAELALEDLSHLGSVVGVEALGHYLSRDEAVLRDDVLYAGELAAVGERILEEPFDEFVVHRLGGVVDSCLEEEVALLELVVEEAVGLRELEVAEVELSDGASAHDVESGEEPAATAVLLVGDA